MFAPLEGRVADPELGEVGNIREAETRALQELCRGSAVRSEHRNDSDDGEAENSCLKTPVQKVSGIGEMDKRWAACCT